MLRIFATLMYYSQCRKKNKSCVTIYSVKSFRVKRGSFLTPPYIIKKGKIWRIKSFAFKLGRPQSFRTNLQGIDWTYKSM